MLLLYLISLLRMMCMRGCYGIVVVVLDLCPTVPEGAGCSPTAVIIDKIAFSKPLALTLLCPLASGHRYIILEVLCGETETHICPVSM